MGLFSRKKPEGPSVSSFVDSQGNALSLVLYQYPSCPFCRRVSKALAALNYEIEYKNTIRDSKARDELLRVGGKTTVPCLFVNGKPMYESADIVRYLQNEVKPA